MKYMKSRTTGNETWKHIEIYISHKRIRRMSTQNEETGQTIRQNIHPSNLVNVDYANNCTNPNSVSRRFTRDKQSR